MAIFKLGPLVIGIRGTIGGIIFSANAAGNFCRSWARPTNPRSPLQQQERQFIGGQSQGWRSLSDAQRDDWIAFAAAAPQELFNSLGISYFASGFNWFVKLNQYQLQAGELAVTDAPLFPNPTPPPINSGTVDVAAQTALLVFTATTFTPDRLPVVFLSTRLGQSTANPGNQLLLQILPHPGPIATTLDLSAAIITRFGAIRANTRYFFSVASQDPGEGTRSSTVAKTIDSA